MEQKFSLDKFLKDMREDFKDFEPLTQLSQKTNVKTHNILLGTVILILSMVMNGILSDFWVYFIGFSYPFYQSCKSLLHKNKKKQKFWLVYWVIFFWIKEFSKILRILLFFVPKNAFNFLMICVFIGLFYPKSTLIPLIEANIVKLMRKNSRYISEFEEKFKENWKKITRTTN